VRDSVAANLQASFERLGVGKRCGYDCKVLGESPLVKAMKKAMIGHATTFKDWLLFSLSVLVKLRAAPLSLSWMQ